MESKVVVPAEGKKITVDAQGKLVVPHNPIIPFIEGDGIGVDVTPAMIHVVDAAVKKAYHGERKISWMEIYTGEKSTHVYGKDVWLPDETLDLIRDYRVAIKGPLTTPVGGGIRSLNVALRQQLDLYVCLRPVRYYQGTPSPVKQPELTDMVIFRENAEDIYAGIEWKAGSAEADKVIKFLRDEMGVKKIRFPEQCGIGVKPCSEEGTKRLVRAAIEYAITNDRDSVTLVHKGNIMKFTEGAFKDWGYELAREEFGGELIDGGPWLKIKNPNTGKEIVVKDVIADAFLAADPTAPGGIRRDRLYEPERRLHLRRPGGPGRRHRHRTGRQHRLRLRAVRSDSRHRAEVRRPGQSEPRLHHPVRRDDAAPHGLVRSG